MIVFLVIKSVLFKYLLGNYRSRRCCSGRYFHT